MSHYPATEKATYVLINEFTKVVRQVFEYQSGSEVETEPTLVTLMNKELGERENDELLSSLITLEGGDYHCSLVLVGATSIVTSLAQVEVDDPRDWIGELTNLVAGGMANNFYAYNTENYLGLPTNVSHNEWVTNDFDWEILEVRTKLGTVFASLNCNVVPDTEWTLTERATANTGAVYLLDRDSQLSSHADHPASNRDSEPTNRILVIDDSSTVRKLVARPLRKAGYEVVEAADGQEGVTMIRDNKLDCVVCDLHLPCLNGLDLVRVVKQDDRFRDLPIVMLSTEGKQSVINQAKTAGAAAWIVKPCDLELLVKTVTKFTRPRELTGVE